MAAKGAPTDGFPNNAGAGFTGNPDNERDSWRLLFVMMMVVGAGAGAFLAMGLQM